MRLVLILIFMILSAATSASSPTTMAKSDGHGHVNVEVVYFAEDTCMFFKNVKEGVPDSIENTKRSLPITIVLDKKTNVKCEQKLLKLTHNLVLKEKEGINNVEIFYIGTDGKFIRSAKPRIYRKEELEEI